MTAQIRLFSAALVLGFASFVAVQLALGQAGSKPVGEQDIVAMIGLGLDDEAIAARIKKGGLAFEPGDVALQKLKTAGASDVVLKAVQDAAKSKPVASLPQNAVTYEQVLQMLTLGIDEDGVLK